MHIQVPLYGLSRLYLYIQKHTHTHTRTANSEKKGQEFESKQGLHGGCRCGGKERKGYDVIIL